MAKFIKLHVYTNNAPIIINIEHIISVVHNVKKNKLGKEITVSTVLIDATYNSKEYDVSVNESAEKIFGMINDLQK